MRTPVSASRSPVGSSARTRAGSWASARAMATRCCSPPERRSGKASRAVGEPDGVEQARARSRASAGGVAVEVEQHAHVLLDRQRRDEVVELEHEADVAAAEERPVALGERPEVDAVDADLPGVGAVDARDEVEDGALARARAPDERADAAARERHVGPVEDGPRRVALAVAFADAAEVEDGGRQESERVGRQARRAGGSDDARRVRFSGGAESLAIAPPGHALAQPGRSRRATLSNRQHPAPPASAWHLGRWSRHPLLCAMPEALFILVVVIVTALAFDYTNGFHDTANAMATSIATGALSPRDGRGPVGHPEPRRRVPLDRGRADGQQQGHQHPGTTGYRSQT